MRPWVVACIVLACVPSVFAQAGGEPTFGSPSPGEGTIARHATPAISISYSDDRGVLVERVRLWLDGVDVTAGAEVGPDQVRYVPAQPLRGGLHAVNVSVEDADGHRVERAWSFRTPDVDLDPPRLHVTHPLEGATLRGVVEVAGEADDERSLAEVLLFLDSTLIESRAFNVLRTEQPAYGAFTFSLDTTLHPDGPHDLQVVVRDGAGNEASETLRVTFDNQPDAPTPSTPGGSTPPATTPTGPTERAPTPLPLLFSILALALAARFRQG